MQKLNRTDLNFWLDVVLFSLFAALCTCSVIVDFVFPAATQAEGWTLWGVSFNRWNSFRFSILATLAGAVLLHVMLHWSWVCGVVASRMGRKKAAAASRDDPSRTLWGVGLLILVINIAGGIIAAAALMIQPPAAGS
jgi:hypothetical protein